ncbi:hypothetical protein BCR37DRAFT_376028 [Protomyces lactucae-debilis]|uniref:BHLH domain-containing protein n=1 Tax=Protomyces lactucae-debilis TaxID=2754530 RepID=A0A1Y2FS13_PROLT|nr:uncharacterized protein BCR37DRAFT_376028 [Protomyces lactucae-debilis]ORY86792.1 hypothetical protein BCR37DRAFT_376028 [Protomyces lactucae-debilis]
MDTLYQQQQQQQQQQRQLQSYYAHAQFDQVPLFDSTETQAFEKFLDELVVDNQFIFNPRIPTGLDATLHLASHKREEADFERMRRAPLAFNTDPSFASDGYRGTHKFVPVGYGHTHPAFTAQKSPRSSDVSRSTSRSHSVVRMNETVLQATPLHEHVKVEGSEYPGGVAGTRPGVTSLPPVSLLAHNEGWPVQQSPAQLDEHRVGHRKSLSMPVKRATADTDGPPLTPSTTSVVAVAKRPRSTSQSTAKRVAPATSDSEQVGSASKKTLTAAQKRQNHITSEQKRRNLIKEGFETLSQQLPTLKGHGESKHYILTEAIAHIKRLQARRDQLRVCLQELDTMQ